MSGVGTSGIPNPFVPMVNADGTPQQVWFRFLNNLWNKLGKGFSTNGDAVFLASASGGGLPVTMYDAVTGQVLGQVETTPVNPGPAEPQVLVVSPFEYVAVKVGTLIVFSGEVEISRDSGLTWYKVGLSGGALPLLVTDLARVSWFGPVVPEVTFLPSS